MERIHLLAAEIFNYSYANYEDHLGVNERFDKLMLLDAELLETALTNKWSTEKVAEEIDVSEEVAARLLIRTSEALDIVDAVNPAESFRKAVAQSVRAAISKGLDGDEAIDDLVRQICYRAADLGLILDRAEHRLSQYSRHLRKEPDVDYGEGYFQEPFTKEYSS